MRARPAPLFSLTLAAMALAAALAACNADFQQVPLRPADAPGDQSDVAADTRATDTTSPGDLDSELLPGDTLQSDTQLPPDLSDTREIDVPATCGGAVCPSGVACCESASGMACVDLDTHPLHCGECANPCASGACMDGACCDPLTCTSVAGACGVFDDRCGGTVACGCEAPTECAPNGLPNVCETRWRVPDPTTSGACLTPDGMVACTSPLAAEYDGQDASITVHAPAYTALPLQVIDNVTGLHWQRTPTLQSSDFASVIAYCDQLSIDGLSEWRLPTVLELATLLDYAKTSDPMHDAVLDAGPSPYYWATQPGTSTPWSINFDTGVANPVGGTFSNSVRCVHGTTPPRRFLALGLDVVHDPSVGLMWTTSPLPLSSWKEALSACLSLESGGFDDWRLPTLQEQATFLRPAGPPFVDSAFFASQPAEVWTATPNGQGTATVRTLQLVSGDFDPQPLTATFEAFCVRHTD